MKKPNQAWFNHSCFIAVSGHTQTWLLGLYYAILLVSTIMAARRDDFPHLISSCFSKAPIRDSSSLLAKLLVLQLLNSFNENVLGYLKHVKDFAAQDDFDWNCPRAYSYKKLHWHFWQDTNLVGEGRAGSQRSSGECGLEMEEAIVGLWLLFCLYWWGSHSLCSLDFQTYHHDFTVCGLGITVCLI